MRILVDGAELFPAVFINFAFDSVNDGGGSSWESNSIQRYSGNLGAGAHTVEVEADTTNAGTTFTIDDAVLSVMQVAS